MPLGQSPQTEMQGSALAAAVAKVASACGTPGTSRRELDAASTFFPIHNGARNDASICASNSNVRTNATSFVAAAKAAMAIAELDATLSRSPVAAEKAMKRRCEAESPRITACPSKTGMKAGRHEERGGRVDGGEPWLGRRGAAGGQPLPCDSPTTLSLSSSFSYSTTGEESEGEIMQPLGPAFGVLLHPVTRVGNQQLALWRWQQAQASALSHTHLSPQASPVPPLRLLADEWAHGQGCACTECFEDDDGPGFDGCSLVDSGRWTVRTSVEDLPQSCETPPGRGPEMAGLDHAPSAVETLYTLRSRISGASSMYELLAAGELEEEEVQGWLEAHGRQAEALHHMENGMPPGSLMQVRAGPPRWCMEALWRLAN
jgi:hypothetical protein